MLLGGHVVRWACEDDKSALADMDVKQCCGKVWTQEMLGASLELNIELYRKCLVSLQLYTELHKNVWCDT